MVHVILIWCFLFFLRGEGNFLVLAKVSLPPQKRKTVFRFYKALVFEAMNWCGYASTEAYECAGIAWWDLHDGCFAE